MKKTGFLKNFIMCFAAVMAIFAASKAVSAYAGDFTTAIALPTNGLWSGKCELATDTTDYYKFTISTAGEMDIKLMSYSLSLNCNLYDSNFKKIKYIYALSGSETSPNTQSIIQWLSQGTYYVSVEPLGRHGGIYRLYASFSSSGITAAGNDSYDSPQNISINGKASGVIAYSNYEDWYKVTVPSSGKYRHIFQSSGGMNCCLYDANLSELHSLSSSSSSIETGEIELKPGTYYIKILGGGPDAYRNGGTYTYQINEAIPVKGEVLDDSKYQAQYKVTKAGKSGGTVMYIKPINGVKSSVTVPATVEMDGITYKVTGIASNAFTGNSMLKKVTIGKNITSIGTKAFYNCYNLKTITVKSNGLKKVGKKAFKGIKATAKIKVPKKKLSAYKKLFKNKGQGKKVKITK